jgi:hypothetical protein
VEVDYLLRNVGGAAAWAVLVSAATTLGPVGTPARLQPGPGAGEGVRRRLALALAEGQREVCVEARLQTLNADDPGDPEPADNRRCRAIVVAAGEEGGDGRRGQGAGAGGP